MNGRRWLLASCACLVGIPVSAWAYVAMGKGEALFCLWCLVAGSLTISAGACAVFSLEGSSHVQ